MARKRVTTDAEPAVTTASDTGGMSAANARSTGTGSRYTKHALPRGAFKWQTPRFVCPECGTNLYAELPLSSIKCKRVSR